MGVVAAYTSLARAHATDAHTPLHTCAKRPSPITFSTEKASERLATVRSTPTLLSMISSSTSAPPCELALSRLVSSPAMPVAGQASQCCRLGHADRATSLDGLGT